MHFSHLQGIRIIRTATGRNRVSVIQLPAEAWELSVLQSTQISTGDHPDSWIVCKWPLSCSRTFQPINTHLLNCPCIWFRFSTRMGNLRSHVPTMFWTLNSKNFTWKKKYIYIYIYSIQKWYNVPSSFFKAKYFNIKSLTAMTHTHTSNM
jgi:hypothetical protein